MKVKTNSKPYAVAYNNENVIVGIVRNNGTISYIDSQLADFDTEAELDEFIQENKLAEYDYSEELAEEY